MRDANTIVRDRQLAIRREMDRRGVTLKAVSFDSGIGYPTTVSYFPGEKDREPATLNLAGLYMLLEGDALPLDLLSMLLPDGFQIVRAPEEIDHDALCHLANEYVAMKHAAHHPDSEAGREIGPNEEAALSGKVVQFVGLAA